ncbi:MAG: hypothetical protein Q8P24_08815 [Desulfobacterales bacterium]|nr:hypothetical protein [Desulfobacterales bacterium]
MKEKSKAAHLSNDDCIAIAGGGPAGAFFACHLLRESRRLNRRLDVVIVEKRSPTHPGNGDDPPGGCTFCAGGISPRLHQVLEQYGFVVPEEIIQGRIDYIWMHGHWKNFRLRVPRDMRMYSVFRGSLPTGRGAGTPGFDEFLLGQAAKAGARILHAEVQSIAYSASGRPRLTMKKPSGERTSLDAGFAAIATGINGNCGRYGNDALIAAVRRLNPDFAPSRSRRVFFFVMDVGEDYLKRNMHREIHFIEYGSKRFALEHAVLFPKGRYLSAALIGKSIDRAVLPRDNGRIIQEFLNLDQISRILPDIQAAPVVCACFPGTAVTPARSPFGDRFALIGDAAGARLNGDGMFSAHATAFRLAQTILHDGIDRQALAKGYNQAVRWLAADNRCGRMVFRASRVAFSRPWLSRVTYQSFATEFKQRDEQRRPLTAVLWQAASGTADYCQVLRKMFSYGVFRSILSGVLITLRNAAFETLFGLKWGTSGRYPTIVLKEQRRAVKLLLASTLEMELDEFPDFECMYMIKIRGPEKEIMAELAKFGHPQARFLNLRFVSVRHIRGEPNQAGSVIRYRIPLIGLGTEMRLTRRVGSGTLLYQLNEQLSHRGKLVFNVAPTRDGNNRLTIYAAFDYIRGRTLAGRTLWRCARMLFPEFVHDVVWNHALCTIKENVERREYAKLTQ